MNTEKLSVKSWREEQAKWWSDMAPLLRRVAPRWGGCAVLLAGLWVAGAILSANHETAKPQVGVESFDLRDYVKRGRNVPEGDNAATVYIEAAKLLAERKNWKSDSEEAFRIYQNRRNDCFKMTPAHWQDLAAFTAETDGVSALIRTGAQRPQCVFRLREDQYAYTSWGWESNVAGCLVIRALTAGHQGNAAAWRQSSEDILSFLETVEKEQTPTVVAVRSEVLKGLLDALEAACCSGAALDEAALAALDNRLAALRPLDAFEPLLALAWSAINFRHAYHYNEVYPRYIQRNMLEGKTFYPQYLDIPYRAGGFAARDRALTAGYFSELLGILRSGQPRAHERAWAWMTDKKHPFGGAGLETAPNYGDIVTETTSCGWWRGTPGAAYIQLANIRMARAVIAVMRQGRNDRGNFRSEEELRALLGGFPCPMTGGPIICRADADRCSLAYRIYRKDQRFRNEPDWQLGVVLEPPASK